MKKGKYTRGSITPETLEAVKILKKSGVSTKQMAVGLKVSAFSIYRLRQCQTWEEYQKANQDLARKQREKREGRKPTVTPVEPEDYLRGVTTSVSETVSPKVRNYYNEFEQLHKDMLKIDANLDRMCTLMENKKGSLFSWR